MPAFEHDDVGILAARLNKLLVHGLDRREVLRDDAFKRAAAVAHVAQGAVRRLLRTKRSLRIKILLIV